MSTQIQIASSGGLPTTITNPVRNDELYYDPGSSKWVNTSPQNKSRKLYQIFQNDFLNSLSAACLAPFASAAIGNGTIVNQTTSTTGGLGVVALRSGTFNSSGAIIGSSAALSGPSASGHGAIIPTDEQRMDLVFKTPASIAPFSTIRVGFLTTSGGASDTVNGFYMQIYNGNVFGVTANGGIRSATPTGLIGLSVNTWYHARITNQQNTTILYEVYSQTGTLLWSETLNTNLPTAAVNIGIQATADISSVTAQDLILVDYMGFYCPIQSGTRGALV
jgi:hypothetical protein